MIVLFSVLWLMNEPLNYEACTALVEADPQAAYSYAEKWGDFGGDDEAQHCRALAALALNKSDLAAQLLEALAEKQKAHPGVATRLYIQAAEAWMAGAYRSESYAALREAYGLAPNAPELHMAAATIYATGGQWEGVVLALKALEHHAPLSADALALRARAYFQREEYLASAGDVAAALTINPLLIDALVLRGDLAAKGVNIPADPGQ